MRKESKPLCTHATPSLTSLSPAGSDPDTVDAQSAHGTGSLAITTAFQPPLHGARSADRTHSQDTHPRARTASSHYV